MTVRTEAGTQRERETAAQGSPRTRILTFSGSAILSRLVLVCVAKADSPSHPHSSPKERGEKNGEQAVSF